MPPHSEAVAVGSLFYFNRRAFGAMSAAGGSSRKPQAWLLAVWPRADEDRVEIPQRSGPPAWSCL